MTCAVAGSQHLATHVRRGTVGGHRGHEGADIMAGALANRQVAFLVAAEGAEQVELTEPWRAVEEADGTPRLISPASGQVRLF